MKKSIQEETGQTDRLAKGSTSRRRLLKGLFAALLAGDTMVNSLFCHAENGLSSPVRTNILRPPGAVPEEIFPAKCIRCGRCVEVCPYEAIVPRDIRNGIYAGTPLIDVTKIPCYLCMKCVEVCPTGTLSRISQTETRMASSCPFQKYHSRPNRIGSYFVFKKIICNIITSYTIWT